MNHGSLRPTLTALLRLASGRHEPTSGPIDLHDALSHLDAIRTDCRRLVQRRAALSAATAVIPLPGLDTGTDILILLKLLPRINARFGLTPAQIEGLDVETKRLVMVFIGSVGSTLIGRIVTRDLVLKVLLKLGVRVTAKGVGKFVPLLGQALSASISFGAMKLLGDRHVEDCHEVARRTLLAAHADHTANVSDALPMPSNTASTR